MAVKFSNNAATLLAANASTSTTLLTVDNGSIFPTLSGTDHTYVTLEDVNANREVVKVTAISGNTLTVVRAQDGTTARAFSTADKCELRITAALLNDLNTDADTESVSIAGDTMTGNLNLGDNVKLQLGNQTNGDLQIYHDGSHSYIKDAGSGILYVQGSGQVRVGGSDGTTGVEVNEGGDVKLRYNNANKLATTSTGIDVTGSVTADEIKVGATDRIYLDGGSNTYIQESASDDLRFFVGGQQAVRVRTFGTDILGTVTADGLTVANTGFARITLQDSDATNQKGYIDSSGGDLNLTSQNGTSHGDIFLKRYNGTSTVLSSQFASNGDISFYNSAGTSQNFYWDSSTSRLGLGVTNPSGTLDIGGQHILSDNYDAVGAVFRRNGTYGSVISLGRQGVSDGVTLDYPADNTFSVSTANTERLKVNVSGIDVTGSVVADGLTSELGSDAQGKFSGWSPTGSTSTVHGAIELGSNASYQGIISYDGSNNTRFLFDNAWSGTGSTFEFRTNTAATAKTHLKIEGTGDISFYNSAGTSQNFYWDSSASSLGIGTTSVNAKLHVSDATAPTFRLSRTGTGQIWQQSIDSSGRFTLQEGASEGGTKYTRLQIDDTGEATFSGSVTSTGLTVNNGSINVNSGLLDLDAGYSIRWGGSASGIYSGSGTSDMVFTAGSAERFRVNGLSGNVGINDSNPSNKLTVNSNSGAGIKVYGADQAYSRIAIDNLNGQEWNLVAGTAGASNSGFGIYDADAGATRLQIDSSGNVGIGTSSPNEGSSGTQHSVLTVKGSGSLGNGILELIQKGTTGNNQTLGDIKFFDNTNHNVSIEALRATSTDSGTLAFKTRAASGSLTERMRLNSDGSSVFSGAVTTGGNLKVYTAGYPQARLGISDSNYFDFTFDNPTDTLKIGKNGSAKVTVGANGNVNIPNGKLGVGFTTVPSAALHTSGNVAAGKFESTSSTYVDIDNGTVTGRLQTISSVFNIGTATAGTSLALKSGNGVEAMKIDASGRVGIGNTSPDSVLTVVNAASTAALRIGLNNTSFNYMDADNNIFRSSTGAERMRIGSTGSVGIGSSTGASAYGTKLFVEDSSAGLAIFHRTGSGGLTISADNDGPILGCLDNADSLRIFTGSAERMRIDSSGNLLVGKTTQGLANAGFEVAPTGQASATQSGASCLRLNRLSSDGEILQFRKDTSQVGGIGVMHTNNMYFTGASGHGGLQFGTANVTPLIAGSESNGGVDLGASNLRFKDLHLSGSAFIDNQTRLGNGSASSPAYSFSADSDSGMFRATTNQLGFATGGQEAARIDASQNFLVGKTSSGFNTAGVEFASSGRSRFTRDSANVLEVNRLSNDGSLMTFSRQGTTVGSIGTASSVMYFGSGDVALRTNPIGDAVEPFNTTNTNVRDALIDLGSSGARFKDLYLSGGVYLGGTGAANKLDDYEEGTWTPVWTSSTSTVVVHSAVYTKVGNLVTVHAYISNISPATNTSSQNITGLPFTCSSSSHYGTGNIVYSGSADVEGIGVLVNANSSFCYFHYIDGTSGSELTCNNWNTIKSSGLPLVFSATYRTDS